MNFKTVKLSVISAAALALSASQGVAQNSGRVSVKVPFDFVAGATPLPAGTYNFSEDRSGVMHITSSELHKAIVVLTNPDSATNAGDSATVKFDKVNGQYSLSEVNMLGEPGRHVLRMDDRQGHDEKSVFTSRLAVTNATAKSLR